MMTVALLGQKVGMTQVFDENGNVAAVTVLEVGPCQVLQVKSVEKDGYHALQLGFKDKPRDKATRPERGHVARVGAEPKRLIREVRLDEPAASKPGEVLTVELFKDTRAVDVIGTMKGRGFSGVMKRHGFSGLETTHGVLRKHRAAGSIGCNTSPGRVIKGKRMNGQYGNTRATVRNLKVVRVDPASHCLLVRGAVPGANGQYVIVRQTNKRGN
jgi:large subunit ribosomal protein L3